jgi:hypothetical protein
MSNYNAPPPSYTPSAPATNAPAYTPSVDGALSVNEVVAQLRARADAAETAATAATRAHKSHYREVSDAYLSLRDAAESAIRFPIDRGTEEIVHDHLFKAHSKAPWKTSFIGSAKDEERVFDQTADAIRLSAFQAFVLSRHDIPLKITKRGSRGGPSFWLCGTQVRMLLVILIGN